jgi:hypothetical protein
MLAMQEVATKNPNKKLQARYFQAMTKLLTVLARQNQVLINVHQAQTMKSG